MSSLASLVSEEELMTIASARRARLRRSGIVVIVEEVE